jgi:hypothetical protein
LWDSQSDSDGSIYYRFKFSDTIEPGSFNTGCSKTSYNNMPLASGSAVLGLCYLHSGDTADVARVDINVTVPSGEYYGNHSSTITFTAVAS